jgi:hypothetical protein
MSEKELSEALLKLDALDLAAVPDMQQQTWRVLERDRRRIRWLTGLTIMLWLIAVGAVLFLHSIYFLYIVPHEQMLMREAGKPDGKFERASAAHTWAPSIGTAMITGSIALLALSVLCTVVLVLTSRRATLRQVNASLIEISEQLRQLRQAPSAPSPGPPGGA